MRPSSLPPIAGSSSPNPNVGNESSSKNERAKKVHAFMLKIKNFLGRGVNASASTTVKAPKIKSVKSPPQLTSQSEGVKRRDKQSQNFFKKIWGKIVNGIKKVTAFFKGIVSKQKGISVVSDKAVNSGKKESQSKASYAVKLLDNLVILLNEKKAHEQEGLFRLQGDDKKLKKFDANRKKHGGEANPSADCSKLFDETDGTLSSHDVAVALKRVMRDLAPLDNVKEKFLNIDELKTPGEKLAALKEVLKQVPQDKLVFLEKLVAYLGKVAGNSETNKMQPNNLAICLGPNLFRPDKDPMRDWQDSKAITSVFALLIENRKVLFEKSA